LRREINGGLNVVEQWNGATDFVRFARRGEFVSNVREDHEVSMLSLELHGLHIGEEVYPLAQNLLV
jgi:TnpA family transposase